MSSDPNVYPGTRVLVNKLGIKNADRLNQYEYDTTYLKAKELKAEPVKGNFDLKYLQKIHKHLFNDLYLWAGQVRTVSISKGGGMFAFPQFIESEGNKLFTQLKNEDHLKNLDKDNFSKRAAHYFTEINALHPFRDGNGRAQQLFMSSLAEKAGHSLDWSKTSQKELDRSSIDSFNGDLKKIESVFNKVTIELRSDNILETKY